MKFKWFGMACGGSLIQTLIFVRVMSLTVAGKWLGAIAAILLGISALLYGVFADPNQARYIHRTSSKEERHSRERWGTLFLMMSVPFIVLSLILLASCR